MSSFAPRIQIPILKRKGFLRQTHAVINGQPIKLKHGPILNPDGTSTGALFWPIPRILTPSRILDKCYIARHARDLKWGRA